GINPEAVEMISIALAVFISWGRALIGKEAFDREFWQSFLIILLLPALICGFLRWAGLPILVLGGAASAVFVCVDLGKRRLTHPNSKGLERTPVYPKALSERSKDE